TKKVKQLSACRVAQRFENLVSVHRSHSNVRTQYAGKYLHVNWQLMARSGRWSPLCADDRSQGGGARLHGQAKPAFVGQLVFVAGACECCCIV
ncbi:hypothetical protein, partial [Bradyrhizobium sp.]|uniref:hypothetical protein n=1 Tax=Bradyrhizobium sp. TaxID=376 RepID=UPI003C73D12A